MSFTKVERSYYTPNGWRLATFEEARSNLEAIKEQCLLNKWDRVRLLNGWISGPGYNFEMGNDFRSCLGYMLLIETQAAENFASGCPYENVDLSNFGKEVALFLCVDDWNFEVVYWVLNSWSKSETMELCDVRGGNLPISDAAEFKEMNRMMGSVARRLGDGVGAELEKAGNRKYSGIDSVKEVLSGAIKFLTEDQSTVQLIRKVFRNMSYDEYCLPMSVVLGDDDAVFWRFACDSFAGYVVEVCALTNLRLIRKMKTSRRNFIIASSILLYLSDFRTDIIHAPLAHCCKYSCAQKILLYTAEKAAGHSERFVQMLQNNPMWRCYDDTDDYHLLNKLLIVVAKGKYNIIIGGEEIAEILVANMLLECGAQPGPGYEISRSEKVTVLYYAVRLPVDVGIEITKSLLEKCDEKGRDDFVNATTDGGITALHLASWGGNARVCQMLLDYGARLDARDSNGRTALHIAVEERDDAVINVFMKNPSFPHCVDLEDKEGGLLNTIITEGYSKEIVAKFLSVSKQPENYFHKVDVQDLLRECLVQGYVNVVEKLCEHGVNLCDGDDNDQGKTTLHLAAQCDDEREARFMLKIILDKTESKEKENFVRKCDRRGRTALHDAALSGHASLSKDLLNMYPAIINIKDRDGRNPFYDAVKAKDNGVRVLKKLLKVIFKKGMNIQDLIDHMDRSGQTPLHVAASLGKTEVVDFLLSRLQSPRESMKKSDFLGKTALHMATSSGHANTVKFLLEQGAHPLRERDCDRRTALHYAVQAKSGEEGKELVNLILEGCKSNEEKLLLLWASAAGLGTADQNLSEDDLLQTHLLHQKEEIKKQLGTDNLLRTAAHLGDIEMTKELLTRGCHLADILDTDWTNRLPPGEKKAVEKVSKHLERISEQGNDQPTISDNLGRIDYAHGLAALFLNPFIKSPLAVGISGSWGAGKSSLMIQTEGILLKTAAQLALLPSSKLPSSDSSVPGVKTLELSEKGKLKYNNIKRQVDLLIDDGVQIKNGHNQESLVNFLNNYEPKYHAIFKSLAVMDSSDMFTANGQGSELKRNSQTDGVVPAILTVRYNAWKYRNETEALAGMAVEITKEMEATMNQAQWLSTCWRNTWKNNKYTIWIEIIYPSLLAVVLAFSFVWIVWIVLDKYKFKESAKTKYACLPAAIVIMGWTLTRSVMGILKPVSTQLMNYIAFPDHTAKLGYQERVINDIIFLKDEIGKKPCSLFTAFVWLFTALTVLWRMVCERWLPSLFSNSTSPGKTIELLKISPASSSHLRIIVFVDDLDRCQEAVILQVLSAINLVLAVCEINVVLGMDKGLIERAIIKKHGDTKGNKSIKHSKELADKYLQKIIQLPLDLPDPSEEESQTFLKGQLGVYQKQTQEDVSDSETDVTDPVSSREPRPHDEVEIDAGLHEGNTVLEVAIEMRNPPEISNKSLISSIPIREMLFITYSEGEQDAFCYFQKLATECRKIPREWKRLLNYHRLVWYIFSLSEQSKVLAGWQVQLITWIFMCWEWQENMNLLIENWEEINLLKTSESDAPSLLLIVDHFIEENERNKNREMAAANYEGDPPKVTDHPNKEDASEKVKEAEGSVAKNKNIEEPESSSIRAEILHNVGENKLMKISKSEEDISKMADDSENREKVSPEKLVNDMKEKLDTLEKTLAGFKEEIKELKEQVSDQWKKEMKELKEQVSDELKKNINELRDQIMKKQSGKNEKKVEDKKTKLNIRKWEKMKSALKRYDVPMEGIQAFQRFRFYCVAGYLPRPSSTS